MEAILVNERMNDIFNIWKGFRCWNEWNILNLIKWRFPCNVKNIVRTIRVKINAVFIPPSRSKQIPTVQCKLWFNCGNKIRRGIYFAIKVEHCLPLTYARAQRLCVPSGTLHRPERVVKCLGTNPRFEPGSFGWRAALCFCTQSVLWQNWLTLIQK